MDPIPTSAASYPKRSYVMTDLHFTVGRGKHTVEHALNMSPRHSHNCNVLLMVDTF